MSAYSFLNVGVSSLERAEKLWCEMIGMEALDSGPWHASAMEVLWGLRPGAIRQSRLLRTPGAPAGFLHLVEFADPAPIVRENAAAMDLCPKNLDVNVIDLPRRLEEIEAIGFRRLSEPVAYVVDGLQVREVQVPLDDGVNLVLAEIIGEAFIASDKGYGSTTSIITTTSNMEAEVEFLSLLGLAPLGRHLLEGPEVEKMVGLPPGAKLEMQLLGEAEHRYGRAELVCYHGVKGKDLYPRSRPPARGLFRAAIWVDDCVPAMERVRAAGYDARLHTVPTDAGFLVAATVVSPSGWIVDLLETQERSAADMSSLSPELQA